MKTLLFFFLLLTGLSASAQQLNTSSFYELSSVLHNPATAGSRLTPFFGVSFKKQWSSMPGSPKTGMLYGQAYLKKAKIGLGGYLYHDVTGPTARTGLQLAYAYHLPVGEKKSFSLGLEARLQQLSFNWAKLQAALGAADPVSAATGNRVKGDAGFGIAYTSPHLQVGAAVSQLMQTDYTLYRQTGNAAQQSQLYRHYYLHGAYTWAVDENTTAIPNTLLIYLPNAPLGMQSGVRIVHNHLLWYGLSWRMRQGWQIATGLKLKEKFSVGYSFDIYSAPLSVYEKGSAGHELWLHYELR